MKSLIVLTLGIMLMGAGFSTLSLTNVVSIIQLADGTFDVLCKDHLKEIVTKEDLINENLCPHIPPQKKETLDVLFVIDNSGSMNDSQDKLSTLTTDIVNNLKMKNSSIQIAVTTTDAYREKFYPGISELKKINGKSILTLDDLNLEDSLSELFSQGIIGSGDERPFLSLQTVLSNPKNSNFYRGGKLQIVILTDEDDFSHHGHGSINDPKNPKLDSVTQYFDYLYQLTQSNINVLNFKVSSLAIFDQNCLELLNSNFLGRMIAYRIGELVDQSAGEKISVCQAAAPNF